MGREMKRVPLDFAWPIDKIWQGYLNPYSGFAIDCLACATTGYAPQARLFSDQWYGNAPFDPSDYGATPLTVDHPGIAERARRNVEYNSGNVGADERAIAREALRLFEHWCGQWSHHLVKADVDALVAANRLHDFTHVARTDEQRETVKAKVAAGGNSWTPEPNGYTPTADEVNTWSITGSGHDSINQWVCVAARCEREGVPLRCTACGGDGFTWPTADLRKLHEDWTKIEPPPGPGFQLWTTTNEGAPISPVFATIEALCEHAAEHCTTFGSARASAEKWRHMLDADFVCHVEGNAVFL